MERYSARPFTKFGQVPEGACYWSHRVFCCLDWACSDNLSGRFGLEHHGLASERIGAFPRFGGRLLDNHEFGESRNQEHAGLLELLVADRRQRLQHALDVLLCQFTFSGDLLDQLRLRHLVCHFVSYGLIRPSDNISKFALKTRVLTIYTALLGAFFGLPPPRPARRTP